MRTPDAPVPLNPDDGELLAFISGVGKYATTGAGMRSYPESAVANEMKIHAGCLRLEAAGLIERRQIDGAAVLWMPTAPEPAVAARTPYPCICGRMIESPPADMGGFCSLVCGGVARAHEARERLHLDPGAIVIFAMHPRSFAYLVAGPVVLVGQPTEPRAVATVHGLEVEIDPAVAEGVIELRVSARAFR
jgi:hypothetical protein